jgi:TRAP-type mannitol/chloroaromatic compound transport system permease small subunit
VCGTIDAILGQLVEYLYVSSIVLGCWQMIFQQAFALTFVQLRILDAQLFLFARKIANVCLNGIVIFDASLLSCVSLRYDRRR